MEKFWKSCLFLVLTCFFALTAIYLSEVYDLFDLRKENISVEFHNDGENLIMTWQPLPYPCTYKIETFSKTTGILENSPHYHLLTSAETSESSYKVPRTPIQNFYRISAQGIFTEVFKSEKIFANPNFIEPPRPITISHYTKKNPASLMPFLIWHTVPTAVCYELELLSAPPEIEGGINHSENFSLATTVKIFTNGYQADLRPFAEMEKIYWRVRALGLHKGENIGEFSIAEPIYIDKNLPLPNCPLINNFDFMDYAKLPIYPAYSWIPIHDAPQYEVELLNHPPKVENDVEPSPDSLWRQKTQDQSSIYDEYSRPYAGPYYWRVRALDENNNPIGTWSNSQKFVVEDYTKGVNTAIFGDSISHGGGSVSYSPRSLEYSYATYIDFPVLNLSKSGDTAHTSLERFSNDVLMFHPKNLIISTGTNCLRDESITVESIVEDLKKIEKLCIKNNIRPIFLTLTPLNPPNIKYIFRNDTDPHWHEKLNIVNDFIRKRQFCIDIEPYFYDEDEMLSSNFSIDGIHPDIRGKMLIAEIINLNKHLFIK